MTRRDDDSWDLASCVGATATMVAAGRAIATKDVRALINDRFDEGTGGGGRHGLLRRAGQG